MITTITIRHADPKKLLTALREKLGPNANIGSAYGDWKFQRFEVGARLDCVCAAFETPPSTSVVRQCFAMLEPDQPYQGMTQPFLEMLAQHDLPDGWYATLPKDTDCFEGVHRLLQAPAFSRILPPGFTKPLCALDVGPISSEWAPRYKFLAFRPKL